MSEKRFKPHFKLDAISIEIDNEKKAFEELSKVFDDLSKSKPNDV